MKLRATGKALPKLKISADQIDELFNFEAGYCLRRGGVQHRYFADSSETQAELGAVALHNALNNAGLTVNDIDLLIGACAIPQQSLPSTSTFIAQEAKLPAGLPVFDVNSSCTSFLTALQVAQGLLLAKTYHRIAIVAVDFASRGLDWKCPEASLIFGDGAAAAIVENSLDSAICAQLSQNYPEGRHFCQIIGGGTECNPLRGSTTEDFLFKMDGKRVFRLVAEKMPEFLSQLTHSIEGGMDSIECVIPHQASHLGLRHMTERLNIDPKKLINIYSEHGNQVAASLPTALHEAVITGKAVSGKRILLLGTGAGLNLSGIVWNL